MNYELQIDSCLRKIQHVIIHSYTYIATHSIYNILIMIRVKSQLSDTTHTRTL